MPTPRALLVPFLLSTLLPAQVQGGDIVVTDYSARAVFRVTPAGQVSTLYGGSPLQGPSGIAATPLFEVLIADFTTNTLLRLPRGGPITPVASGLQGPIRVAVDLDGTYLVTALTGKALLRVTPAGTVTTIYGGAPFVRPFGVAVDGSGDYLVTDDSTDALYRITRTGGLTTLWSGPPFALPQGVAVLGNGDFAVIDGVTDSVYRVPRAGGMPVVIAAPPALLNPEAVVGDFEGRLLIAESHIQGNRVQLVEPDGKVTMLAQGAPFANLEALARVPQLGGPVRAGTGQTTTFQLEMPNAAGQIYAVWATASLYPGIGLGGSDTRWIPGNLDLLFTSSFGRNDGLFLRWVGVLAPPNGTAAPALALPPITLPPLQLHLQALTFDPARPGPIQFLTNLHPLAI
jgi:hypothetical protein